MPTKITYIGPLRSPHDERGDVEIADTGQWARVGVPVEVDTELADQLLQQAGNWARPTSRATSRAAQAAGGKPTRRSPRKRVAPPSQDDSSPATGTSETGAE